MQTYRVYPNPFAAFDKNGVPCGVCPRDPDADAGGPGMFVGARVDKKNTRVLQDFASINGAKFGSHVGAMIARGEIRSPRQVTLYEYMGVESCDPELAAKLGAKDAIEIPATKYYKDRLRDGSLIAADIKTSRAAKLIGFQPPAQVLAHLAPKPALLPETPGLDPLPQSPDADGNLLEAPALPEGENREGVTLPADGAERQVELEPNPVVSSESPLVAEPVDTDTRYAIKKRNRNEA